MPLPTGGHQTADPFGATSPPVLSPDPLFLLSASADRYEVIVINGEPELVPILSRHPIAPGFNGITTRPKMDFDPSEDTEAFRAKLARKGEVVIPLTLNVPRACLPPGAPEGGYLRRMEVKPHVNATKTITHHHEVWETITAGRKGAAQRDYNQPLFAAWRLWLRDEGHVPGPSEAVKTRLIRAAETGLTQRRTTPSADANLKAEQIAAAQARLELAQNAHSAARPKAGKPPKPAKAADQPAAGVA